MRCLQSFYFLFIFFAEFHTNKTTRTIRNISRFSFQVPFPLLNGTILSYQHGTWNNLLLMRSGPSLTFQIWNQSIDSELQFKKNRWYHVVWTWNSTGKRFSSDKIIINPDSIIRPFTTLPFLTASNSLMTLLSTIFVW